MVAVQQPLPARRAARRAACCPRAGTRRPACRGTAPGSCQSMNDRRAVGAEEDVVEPAVVVHERLRALGAAGQHLAPARAPPPASAASDRLGHAAGVALLQRRHAAGDELRQHAGEHRVAQRHRSSSSPPGMGCSQNAACRSPSTSMIRSASATVEPGHLVAHAQIARGPRAAAAARRRRRRGSRPGWRQGGAARPRRRSGARVRRSRGRPSIACCVSLVPRSLAITDAGPGAPLSS